MYGKTNSYEFQYSGIVAHCGDALSCREHAWAVVSGRTWEPVTQHPPALGLEMMEQKDWVPSGKIGPEPMEICISPDLGWDNQWVNYLEKPSNGPIAIYKNRWAKITGYPRCNYSPMGYWWESGSWLMLGQQTHHSMRVASILPKSCIHTE